MAKEIVIEYQNGLGDYLDETHFEYRYKILDDITKFVIIKVNDNFSLTEAFELASDFKDYQLKLTNQ
jgi:hypothetical protein